MNPEQEYNEMLERMYRGYLAEYGVQTFPVERAIPITTLNIAEIVEYREKIVECTRCGWLNQNPNCSTCG